MRLAAAATAGAMLCAGGMVPARGDDVRHLIQENCTAYQATPSSELTNAWQLQRLGMESVWRLATGSGIRIAVIDTGVSTLGSPYLADKDRFVVRDMIPPRCGRATTAASTACTARSSRRSWPRVAAPTDRRWPARPTSPGSPPTPPSTPTGRCSPRSSSRGRRATRTSATRSTRCVRPPPTGSTSSTCRR
nr:hypothetical protein [Tessaracoccus coleopterorum]